MLAVFTTLLHLRQVSAEKHGLRSCRLRVPDDNAIEAAAVAAAVTAAAAAAAAAAAVTATDATAYCCCCQYCNRELAVCQQRSVSLAANLAREILRNSKARLPAENDCRPTDAIAEVSQMLLM